LRTAKTEIEIVRIRVGRYGRITGYAEAKEPEIGKLRWLAIIGWLAQMAARAIALRWILEQRATM
jgi:hypothetical protein